MNTQLKQLYQRKRKWKVDIWYTIKLFLIVFIKTYYHVKRIEPISEAIRDTGKISIKKFFSIADLLRNDAECS